MLRRRSCSAALEQEARIPESHYCQQLSTMPRSSSAPLTLISQRGDDKELLPHTSLLEAKAPAQNRAALAHRHPGEFCSLAKILHASRPTPTALFQLHQKFKIEKELK